jgi:hypothetical protein
LVGLFLLQLDVALNASDIDFITRAVRENALASSLQDILENPDIDLDQSMFLRMYSERALQVTQPPQQVSHLFQLCLLTYLLM